jgi:RNA recognition motif-containing protein
MKIYVGNLSYSTSDQDIRTAFGQFGSVETADVILDRSTGRSKGFGFVEMPDASEAKAAIDGLNGNEAKPRTDRPARY